MLDVPTLTQQAAGAGATTEVFVQYGALGVIALLALLAVRALYLREAAALDRERERRDAAEVELRAMNAKMQDTIVPILTEATRVISEVLEHTRDRR